jgi:hypothetical protein
MLDEGNTRHAGGAAPALAAGVAMSGGIFLIRDDDQLVELASAAYDSEDLLQDLLARYPNLLAGDQIDTDAPRRWLLVKREAPVPAEPDGTGRWSLDHLFLDQEGIPTLVEVKRSTDTRLRREVVGQMLDYAANGVAHWPVETIRAMFGARVLAAGQDENAVLSDFVGPGLDPEAFWNSVKVNLQAGRIRLVFVADEIPPELRRVVEFLNNQMDPAEVVAIEVRQYVGGNFRGLVPRVVGQTERGNRKKYSGSAGPVRQWDKSILLGELERRHGQGECRVAQRLLDWARARGGILWWGTGGRSGSVFVGSIARERRVFPFAIWTYGKIEVQFQALLRVPSLASEDRRREFRNLLCRIPGISIPDDALTKRPSFPLAILDNDERFNAFVCAIAWVEESARQDP